VGGYVFNGSSSLFFLKGLLADKKDLRLEEEEDDRNLNYIAPVQKSLEEIRQLDQNDESLVKYKQTLLGRETRPAGVCVCVCVCVSIVYLR